MTVLIVNDNKHLSSEICDLLTISFGGQPNLVIRESVGSGIQFLKKNHVELILLDMDIENGSGISLLQEAKNMNGKVIVTASDPNYAFESLKMGVLGYLVKPFDNTEFKEVLKRALLKEIENGEASNNSRVQIALPTADGFRYVPINQIIWCQASGSYTYFHLVGKKTIVVSRSLAQFEKKLSDKKFVRIHHSHMINLYHLIKYMKGHGGTVHLTEGYRLEVSRRRKEEFVQSIQ